ncbi:MAG: ABC transporter permease [Spirochaetia bacterium]
MNKIMPIIRKEMKSYFNSPIAYIVVIFFLIFTSVWLFLIQQFFNMDTASMRPYFQIMPIVFVILVPAMTMRSWAEEKKMGTEELLLTLPFRESHVVIGKFLAAFILLAIMVGLSIPVPLSISVLGDFDIGPIIGEYLGVLLLGATGLSIGLFISSVSTNQITAFIFGVIALLIVTLIGQINLVMNLPEWLANVINYISLDFHFDSFRKGLIDTRDMLFFICVSFLFLYLNMKVLIFKKWS